MVVYKGVMPDGFTHAVQRQDGTRQNNHNAHLCLKMQVDLGNIPCTPLDYCKEVGKGITKEEAENLAQPRIKHHSNKNWWTGIIACITFLFPRSFVLQRRVIYQRACLNAKERFPSASHANLGLLDSVLGAHVARPWGPSVTPSTFFLATVSRLTK